MHIYLCKICKLLGESEADPKAITKKKILETLSANQNAFHTAAE